MARVLFEFNTSIPWENRLCSAAYSNNVVMVKRLLDVNNEGKEYLGRKTWPLGVKSPLHRAAIKGHNELIHTLVKGGIDINSFSMFSEDTTFTALHMAAYENLGTTVKLLLVLGADVTQIENFNELIGTPINWAISRENSEIVSLMDKFTLGFNVLKGIKTPLHLAAYFGWDEVISLLFGSGENINVCHENVTALHLAVLLGRLSTVKLLISYGAGITINGRLNELSGTPLDWAKQKGMTEIARLLIVERQKGHPSVTITELELLPLLEKNLGHALDVQAEISAAKQQICQTDRKIADLLEEIKQHNMTKENLQSKIASLEKNPSFQSEQQIELLTKHLQEIKSVAVSLKDVLVSKDNNEIFCPVCFEVPKQVFSCLMCDNWVCGSCKTRLQSCPSCRYDFQRKPPRRNVTVERLFGIS